MPRKGKGGGRGGPRQGAPGRAYANRSDLTQAPRAAPNQTYGTAAAQMASQQQIPLPKQAPPPAPGTGGAAPQGGPAPAPGGAPMPNIAPGGLGGLADPTARPDEPLTAGLPTGPGPGPEALGGASAGAMSPIDEIRALYAAYPTDDMRRLIAYLDGA